MMVLTKVGGMDIGKHIRVARERADLSQAELGTAAGRSANQIGKYERDGASPTIRILAKIATAVQVKASALVAAAEAEAEQVEAAEAEAAMLYKAGDASDGVPGYGADLVDPEEVEIPFVEEWDGTWPLTGSPPHWKVRRRFLQHSKCLITMVKEVDSSMRPYLLGGDAMIIDPLVKKPRSQAMVLVRIGSEVLVRRFVRSRGEVVFQPINPRYDGEKATGKEEILGQVVGIFGRQYSSSMVLAV